MNAKLRCLMTMMMETLQESGNIDVCQAVLEVVCRGRDWSNEEKKKAVKNLVDGHFRALVSQLMLVENLAIGEEDDRELVGDYNVPVVGSFSSRRKQMVKGVVCKKKKCGSSVKMTSKTEKPRILIFDGALDLQPLIKFSYSVSARCDELSCPSKTCNRLV